MAKYEPLKVFLAGRGDGEVPMTFAEIASIIGAPLPPVAFKHRAWWSNNPSNSVITNAWLEAGYKTARVDMGSQKLVFRRADEAETSGRAGAGWLERLRAKMAGSVQVEPGWDLTNPTGEVWDAERE
jgi:hypothetical protein